MKTSLFNNYPLMRDRSPKHAAAIAQAKAERERREAIQARYEASKSARPEKAPAAVDGQDPACAASGPALPSLRCKLCDVRASYPRLCGNCAEAR